MTKKLFVCLVVCYMVWAFAAQGEWVLGPRDTLTSNDVYDQIGSQSLGIDSSDCLHLVWRQQVPSGGWRILYMTKPSEQPWTTPVEIPTIVTNNRVPALAADYPTGISHVVWDGDLGGDYDIFYATNKTSIWETIALTENDYADRAATIATDATGKVHIAWVGYDTVGSENKVFYATDASGDWVAQMVEESQAPSLPGLWETRPWIAVTPEGVAHITYSDCDGLLCEGCIHHLENYSLGDTNWSDELLETDNYTDVFSSVVVEEDGALHLVMSGPTHPDIPASRFPGHCFFRPDSSEPWDSTEIDRWCGTSLALKLDTPGRHHIVADFWWMTFPRILYYSDVSGNWQRQLVLEGNALNSIVEKPSLVLDQAGFGHMAFFNNRQWVSPPGEIFYTKSVEPLAQAGSFIRGDADANELITISDALYILQHLFIPGSPTPSCMDAADVTDNGTVSLQDGIYLLQWLFIPGSPEPPPPFPDCGYDPTWEGLGCSESTCEVQP